jgi:replicative DNA helicase
MNLQILKLLLSSRDTHSRYGKFVKECVDQEDSKELKLICNAIDRLYDEHDSESFSVDDLDIMLSKAYPNQPKTLIEPILERLKNESANEALLSDYLEELRTRKAAHQIAIHALQVYETGKGIETLTDAFNNLQDGLPSGTQDGEDDDFVSSDIAEILTELEQEPGLNWRLKTLNEMLGPLRRGDFGFLFARPETGKTTFLASEVTYMTEQTDRVVLWVNNEEESRKVMRRISQSALGITKEQLEHNKERCAELLKKRTKDLIKINKTAQTSKKQVEQWCKQWNPGLIIMDQIDKITGFEAERHDLKLKAIYQWARELSKQYGPVIAVCQAGGTAENKKWLTMTDVDSSHTAKAGEADWILGIGKLHDEQYEKVRFLHACKNKMEGNHHKKEVIIRPEIGRYEDVQR